MNTTIDQATQNETTCCVDYCLQKFQDAGREVVNLYKCNQRQFSSSDSWDIQKSKKQISIRSGL